MKGQNLLNAFNAQYGGHNQQIGRFFCIAAALSNAVRLLGKVQFTQQLIRDAYYKSKNRIPEASIDDQMQGVSFDVIDVMEKEQAYAKELSSQGHSDAADYDLFNYAKADKAVTFIVDQLAQDRPVIVSTWFIPWHTGFFSPQCCHMWLALAYDEANDLFWIHDSGNNQLGQVPRSSPNLVAGKFVLDIGLRGRITHTDYCCRAIIKK